MLDCWVLSAADPNPGSHRLTCRGLRTDYRYTGCLTSQSLQWCGLGCVRRLCLLDVAYADHWLPCDAAIRKDVLAKCYGGDVSRCRFSRNLQLACCRQLCKMASVMLQAVGHACTAWHPQEEEAAEEAGRGQKAHEVHGQGECAAGSLHGHGEHMRICLWLA